MKQLITFILCFLAPIIQAQEQQFQLFSKSLQVEQNKFLADSKVEHRYLQLDLSVLQQEEIKLSLDPDHQTTMHLHKLAPQDKYSHLQTYAGSIHGAHLDHLHMEEAILVHNEKTGKFVSLIEEEDKYYLILPTDDKKVYRIIENKKEDFICNTVSKLFKHSGFGDDGCTVCSEQDADGNFVVDAFIGFNEDAAAMAGDAEAYAMTMVASVNTGLINSDITEVYLRLVGTGVTTNNPGLVRSILDDALVWFEDELKTTAADLVGVFVTQTGADGESGAWGQQPGRVNANNIIRPLSYRHEVGHNFGGAHCTPDNLIVAYANGYTNGNTSTHLCGNGANFYSNPDLVDSQGNALGDAETADMARFIREQASFISSYQLHTIPFDENDENLDTDGDGYCVEVDCNDADANIGIECIDSGFNMSFEILQNGTRGVVREGLPVENMSALTMSVWVKPSDIFMKNDRSGIAIGESEGSLTGIATSNGKLAVYTMGAYWETSLDLAVDQWAYINMIVGDGQVTACVDGNCESREIGDVSISLDGEFSIGQLQANTTRTFVGKIDELSVMEGMVTTDDLKASRHLIKMPMTQSNLIAYYNFDEPLGPAKDLAKSRNAFLTGCNRSEENAPVGEGSSTKVNIDDAGVYEAEGVSLDFAGALGEIYVTRLDAPDDLNPVADAAGSSYWIINNYSVNATFDNMNSITFTDADVADGDVLLSQRGENDVEQSWNIVGKESAESGSVSFGEVFSFGQFTLSTALIDADGDGFTADVDCADDNSDINPDATEIPNNDIDENCDGMIVIIDEDGDGANSDIDCDDTDASIGPNRAEIPDNDIDENCDGLAFQSTADLYGSYCAPARVDSFGYITWVQVGSILNQSGEATNANGISDFTNLSTILEAGTPTDFLVNSFLDFDEEQVLAIWIDYNKNGSFDEDEQAYSGTSQFETWSSTITVPEGIEGGTTYLRVRISKLGEAGLTACGDATGETEDYSVFIKTDFDDDGFDNLVDCDDSNSAINPDATEIDGNEIDENCDGSDMTSSTFEIDDSVIDIFPNPVSSDLYIRTNDNAALRVNLYDLTGRRLISTQNKNSVLSLDLSSYHSGLYMLEIIHLDSQTRFVDKIKVGR